ncbi:MAG: RNA methyltransferase [Treponema sp.]|nr:RNA methyltransferase [Treponema sp.]
MNTENIVIVLDHPDESRNVGAACRAMANSDIKTLRIVGKKEHYDVEKVHILAIHAAYIFDNAQFFDSITEATADCVMSAGTTRRRGQKRKGKLLFPEEFAEKAGEITGNKGDKNSGKVAIVFGNERSGLSDEQLFECTLGVTIPTSDDFGSLNLSHAVQILCYHMFRQTRKSHKGYTPLTLERLDKTVETIASDLQKIGFFKITGRPDMENFWRSILSRAALSESEAQYLEKIFNKTAGLAGKNQGSK